MDFNNFGKGNSKSFKIVEIRVICKVKFGPKTINFGGKLSFILSFLLFPRASPLLLLHIFSLLLTVQLL